MMQHHAAKALLFNKTLTHTATRAFSIVAPQAKLHFIEHPRYGRVYPVVCMNDRQLFFNAAKAACLGSSLLNSTIVYSLFVSPIFVPAITAVICNPLFILPSFFLNYALFQRYYVYFFNRSFVQNVFLKENGKQVVVETLDGESRVINNKDFFKADMITNRYQHRIDLYHGANNYLFIRGNSYAYDSHILTAVLNNDFIDVRNVAYDYDVTKEFTWDFKELVELKKKKRTVSRFYRPTLRLFQKLQSAAAFTKNQRAGSLVTNRKPLRPFEVFSFQPDQYATPEEKQQLAEKAELYTQFGGSPYLKRLEQQHKQATASSGRRVRKATPAAAAL